MRMALVAVHAALLVCAACSSPQRSASDAAVSQRPVSIAEFSQSSPAASADASAAPAHIGSTVAAADATESAAPPDGPGSDSRHETTDPADSDEGLRVIEGPQDVPLEVDLPGQPGSRIVIDGVIGQINGRPLYASEFFNEYDDRLLRAAEQLTVSEFDDELAQSVGSWIEREIINELVLSEAESMLTPEMQQGLVAWLRDIEERRIAAAGGTRSGAQSAMASEGLTLEQFMRQTRQDILASRFEQEVRSRVVVAWRDIERAYDRRRAEFNPPGTITLYRIALRNREQVDAIETTRQRLADGEPFLDVAADLGLTAEDMRMSELTLDASGEPPGLARRIRDAMPGFDVGDVSDPVESTTLTQWFYVAAIDQPPGRSVYHPVVQRELYEQIWRQRFAEEHGRYLHSLFAKGAVNEMQAMEDRLLQLARARYAAVR